MSQAKLWWCAARPYSFPASIVPALLGVSLAFVDGYRIDVIAGILTVVGVVLAHTGGNLVNDYIDFKKGYDKPGTLGGSGLLVSGELTPKQFFWGAVVLFVGAAAVAVPLFYKAGLPVLWLALFGLFLAVFYVVPPFGLKYRALGDLTVFAAFGVGITAGSYFVQTGQFAIEPLLISIPIGLLVAGILHANNIRDITDDAGDGFKTVAGLAGLHRARMIYASLIIAAYLLAVVFALCFRKYIGALLVLGTLPIGIKMIKDGFSPDARAVYTGLVIRTAQFNMIFGLAMIVGIVMERIIF